MGCTMAKEERELTSVGAMRSNATASSAYCSASAQTNQSPDQGSMTSTERTHVAPQHRGKHAETHHRPATASTHDACVLHPQNDEVKEEAIDSALSVSSAGAHHAATSPNAVTRLAPGPQPHQEATQTIAAAALGTPNADDLSSQPLGISLAALQSFIASLPGDSSDLTTTDICERVVKPRTQEQQCAYIQLMRGHVDEQGVPFVGPATVFISHAWKYKFSDPVDVMINYNNEFPNTYFWFDLFINNQNTAANLPQDWWSTTFRTSIKQIGAVVLVMAPWDNPVPLTRAWCLFEIISALSQEVPLHVRLPTYQRKFLEEALIRNPEFLMLALANIQAERAEAFKETDREMIFTTIRQSLGFPAVNQQVKDQLRRWYMVTAVQVAQAAEQTIPRDEGLAQLLNAVGYSLKYFGALLEGLVFYDKAYNIYKEVFGEEHQQTASVLANIAQLLYEGGKPEKALEVHTRALNIRNKVVGPRTLDTASSYNNLGMIHISQRDLSQANECLQLSLDIKEELLPAKHFDLGSAYNNLALLHSEQGNKQKAIQLYTQALEIYSLHRGPNHPVVGDVLYNIGTLFVEANTPTEGLQFLERAHTIYLTNLGADHPTTKRAESWIAGAKQQLPPAT